MKEITKSDLFIENQDFDTDEENISSERLRNYIEAFEAASKMTYETLYVIDYIRKCFVYVSPNRIFLCGKSESEIRNMGYEHYLRHCDRDELPRITEIHREMLKFFDSENTGPVTDYIMQCNFHITNRITGKRELVCHKVTPFITTKQGKLWLALCCVSLAPDRSVLETIMLNRRDNRMWKYNFPSGKWKRDNLPELSDAEKTVIIMSNYGCRISEIAARLKRSADHIKKIRSAIITKLHARNFTEAVAKAVSIKKI